jgi:hypothetical protein
MTDAQRDQLVLEVVAALAASGIPEHLHGGLVRYFRDGILPGGFLQAVLCNHVADARYRYGGQDAEATIGGLIRFLLDHAPFDAWGSREKVLAWTTTPGRLEIP